MHITNVFIHLTQVLIIAKVLIQLCNRFADILFVDTLQGLCAATKEYYTVGHSWNNLLCLMVS